MTRKGRLKEIFSKALYADNPNLYSVSYREFNSIIKVSLPEFLRLSENFEIIPPNRIFLITREGKVLYRKFGTTTLIT
ncbi:MAG TPA: DUF504 domain-containing protein [Nitrososphaeraceae archaeon]|jgi:hypothetical protein|nr:DUF504 domain-containing protein [Nitrososphaeraceae archaeon]HEX6028561.1 DUF504 domain-containing protein [Nitrososphaeraceae archaeon]